jgi:hypothetical protein
MKSALVWAAALAAVTLSSWAVFAEDEPAAAKLNCKEIMKVGFKEGLCKKVADGKSTKEESQQLLELVTALAANKPPKGDDASWTAKTSALVAAAKACAEGKEGAGAELTAAMNCAACHKEHKPPAQ